MTAQLTAQAMKKGGKYNWKSQPERLIYLRQRGLWHQFKKIGDSTEVWCEVLSEDLHMLEETACEIKVDDSSAQPESSLRCQTCGEWRSTPCK